MENFFWNIWIRFVKWKHEKYCNEVNVKTTSYWGFQKVIIILNRRLLEKKLNRAMWGVSLCEMKLIDQDFSLNLLMRLWEWGYIDI